MSYILIKHHLKDEAGNTQAIFLTANKYPEETKTNDKLILPTNIACVAKA